MTMVDTEPIESAESRAPITEVDDASFREALAQRLGVETEPDDEPEAAAPRSVAPETAEAAPAAPEPERQPEAITSDSEPDYATMRAPELRTHLSRVKQDAQEARTKLSAVESELAELRAHRETFTAREREALASLGDDAEYSRIAEKYEAAQKLGTDPSYHLTDAELATYDALTAQRKHAAGLFSIATNAAHQRNLSDAQERIQKYGLDPKVVAANPSTGALLDHAVAVTEARVAEKFKDQLAEKDAHIADLTTRIHGSRKDPGTAGRSGPPDRYAHVGSGGDSPDDNILAGIRLRVDADRRERRGESRLQRS